MVWYKDISCVVATTSRVNKYLGWDDEPDTSINRLEKNLNLFVEVRADVITKILKEFKKLNTTLYIKYEPNTIIFGVLNKLQKKENSMPITENNNIDTNKEYNIGTYSTEYFYDIFRFHKKIKKFKLYFKKNDFYPIIIEIDGVKYAIAPRKMD